MSHVTEESDEDFWAAALAKAKAAQAPPTVAGEEQDARPAFYLTDQGEQRRDVRDALDELRNYVRWAGDCRCCGRPDGETHDDLCPFGVVAEYVVTHAAPMTPPPAEAEQLAQDAGFAAGYQQGYADGRRVIGHQYVPPAEAPSEDELRLVLVALQREASRLRTIGQQGYSSAECQQFEDEANVIDAYAARLRATPRAPADDESVHCTCEWCHPVDGSVDVTWPAELDPACPVHSRAPADAEPDTFTLFDAMETAWGIIANVSGGDWSRQSEEWRKAAERWRDECWHPVVSTRASNALVERAPTPPEGQPNEMA